MKLRNFIALLGVLIICVACPNDDDDGVIEVEMRDRGEQSLADDELIVEYLQTHFYNYEEFETPPADFDFKIVFDTIAGENLDKTPLIDQVVDTTYNRAETFQTLYKLTAREGVSTKSSFADSIFMNIQGVNLYGETFENSESPIWFDLVGTVDGFMQGLSNSRGGTGFSQNDDGTVTFNNDYEIGAIFVPSGLAFFDAPPSSNIPLFSTLVFAYDVFDVEIADHDNDGVITVLEDLDSNGFLFDTIDNTDEDALFNFVDNDDDNDDVLTRLELDITVVEEMSNNGELEAVEIVNFLDTDGDGISNHLDDDDDGDGILTIDEIEVIFSTGEVTFPDTDTDGVPDYLDSDS